MQKTSASVSDCRYFNRASEYQKYDKINIYIYIYIYCNCFKAQYYRYRVIKVTRSLLLVSDGASISGEVSTMLQKHLSESSLLILSEQNFMELYIFSSLSQNFRNKFRYPSIQLDLSVIFAIHVKNSTNKISDSTEFSLLKKIYSFLDMSVFE